MVCRLERRQGHPPPQSLPLEEGRRRPQHKDAQRRRRKKSPGLGSAAEILQAFAEAHPKGSNAATAARELSRLVGHVPAHHLTTLHIASLVSNWKTRFARNTLYNRRVALRKVLRHYEQSTGVRDLAANVPKVPGYRPRQIVATPAELDALHQHATPTMRLWLRICVAFALGQHEALALSAEHYDDETRHITFTRKKTGEPNKLPVPDDLAELFEAAPDFGDPAMPFLQRWEHGRKVSKFGWGYRWRQLKKKAGVRAIIIPHDLRRTTATSLFELTHDLRIVQQLLGHATMHATVSYVSQTDPTRLRPLLAQLWKPATEVKQ